MQRTLTTLFGALLLLLILIVLNSISQVLLAPFYVDLTEEKLYSLSPGTKKILSGLEEPITLKYYFSRTDSVRVPGMRLYGIRVSNFLEEYERWGDGNIILEEFDPRPDSEEEEWAQSYGISPVPRGAENFYMGLVAINSLGEEEVIPFFDPSKESTLEYDISKSLSSLSKPDKTPIAVISSLDLDGSEAQTPQIPGLPPQPGSNPWFFMTQLRELHDVIVLDDGVEKLSDDTELLLLVHPKELSDKTLFAIDQFVLRGGKLIVLLDPYCQADMGATPPGAPPSAAGKSSQLSRLLDKWGVEMVSENAVADHNLATKVRENRQSRPVDFVLWLSLNANNLNQDDVVTSDLENVLLPWAGALKSKEVEGVEFLPLLSSTNDGLLVQEKDFSISSDPGNLLRKTAYTPGEVRILGARVQGKFKTNFPEGPPGTTTDAEAGMSQEKSHLLESVDTSHVVVISDVDFISDRFSVSVNQIFGQQIATLLNDNAILLQNLIENLSGSNELISIRSRGKSARPFRKVQELEREAEVRFRQKELVFQADLSEAENRLRNLQATGQFEGSEGKKVFTSALLEERKRILEKRREAQQNIRRIRRELRQDVENLGNRLFFINTFAVPLLLVFISIAYVNVRRRRLEKEHSDE